MGKHTLFAWKEERSKKSPYVTLRKGSVFIFHLNMVTCNFFLTDHQSYSFEKLIYLSIHSFIQRQMKFHHPF